MNSQIMNPCRIEFESYSVSGENFDHVDKNIGKLVIILTDVDARHYEPISYFPYKVIYNFSLLSFGPLINKLSGHQEDNLHYIDLSDNPIWLNTVEHYQERLMGKLTGCKVKEDVPYARYSFGFTPFSFFFDPQMGDDPDMNPEYDKVLNLLTETKQEIMDLYRLIKAGFDCRDIKNYYISEFLWESCPTTQSEFNCFSCYFSTTPIKY